MKILFLSYWYPSKNNPLKGIFIKKHAHAVAASGCHLHILSLIIEKSPELFVKETLRFRDEKGIDNTQIVIRSKYYKVFHLRLFYQYKLLKAEFKSIHSEFKPDLIHSHVLYPAAILGYQLSKKYHLPHVITEHWSKVNQFMNKSFYASLGKKAYRTAGAVTVVSNFLKTNIAPFLDLKKTIVVPNIINTSVFSFKEKIAKPDQYIFTIVAHWLQPKRPDLIFYSLNQLSGRISQKIILNVIGEGALLEELKNKNWLFEINYSGNKKPDELASILQNSDYFLHASNMETFSIVIAEALSTGTPVLASRVGAISELVDADSGLLCDENTVACWLENLSALIASKFDHLKISSTTKKYSEEIIGKQLKEIYKNILKV